MQGRGVLQVPVEDLQRNPRQPRAPIEEQDLEELAGSIREHGVLQPLIVTPLAGGEGYQIIAGERRWLASKKAGLETVPVVVRQADDRLSLEWALIENLQRTDLNPIEAAQGYRQLVDDFGLSHEAIADRVGKSRTTITNTLRLLNLAAGAREALEQGAISEGHARALLGLPTAKAQVAALNTVRERGLNVRQTEELVRRLSGDKPKPKAAPKKTPEEKALEDQLRQSLGTRVTLAHARRGGRIVIHYYSDEELDALIEKLLSVASDA
jgi:ParB family chromosome partitioning protein